MAKPEQLDDREQSDKQKPQPGCGGTEQAGMKGGCLTPEKLADVATNHCTSEERKAALAHLTSCRKCYDAWVGVSLSLVAMESGLERQKKRSLLSLRNMLYLGSAVAIAAGAMLLFSLSNQ